MWPVLKKLEFILDRSFMSLQMKRGMKRSYVLLRKERITRIALTHIVGHTGLWEEVIPFTVRAVGAGPLSVRSTLSPDTVLVQLTQPHHHLLTIPAGVGILATRVQHGRARDSLAVTQFATLYWWHCPGVWVRWGSDDWLGSDDTDLSGGVYDIHTGLQGG